MVREIVKQAKVAHKDVTGRLKGQTAAAALEERIANLEAQVAMLLEMVE